MVAPDLRCGGGVTEKTWFVVRTLRHRLSANVRVISLATRWADEHSLLITRPNTWRRQAPAQYRLKDTAVHHVGAVVSELEWMRYQARSTLLALLEDCDVVHVVCGIPAWGWAVRQFRGPIILHFASFAKWERASDARTSGGYRAAWRTLMTAGVGALETAALRRADVAIVVNDVRRREVEEIVGPEKLVRTVRTGVDTTKFAPCAYSADGYLLTVGRLNDPRKNLPLLLTAYADARRRIPALPKLLLAGKYSPSSETESQIRELGLSRVVEYVGAPSQNELADLYRGASLFLLSSNEEGQGIVVLEAMASGVPVIATSCIGPTELMTDGTEGRLVPVHDPRAFSEAIVQLACDEAARKRMSNAARLRAVSEFSLDVAGSHLHKAYEIAGFSHATA